MSSRDRKRVQLHCAKCSLFACRRFMFFDFGFLFVTIVRIKSDNCFSFSLRVCHDFYRTALFSSVSHLHIVLWLTVDNRMNNRKKNTSSCRFALVHCWSHRSFYASFCFVNFRSYRFSFTAIIVSVIACLLAHSSHSLSCERRRIEKKNQQNVVTHSIHIFVRFQ